MTINNSILIREIYNRISKIDNEDILVNIYTFTNEWYKNYKPKGSQITEPAEQTKLLSKIQKVKDMKISRYTIKSYDMLIIMDLTAGSLDDVMDYSFYYGFHQGMKYLKNKEKCKKPKEGSRAAKIQELIELTKRIPDKRLDALICWANQYQE